MIHTVEIDLGGRIITLETGKLAKQAHGSVVVKTGDTVLLSTACANAEPRPGASFSRSRWTTVSTPTPPAASRAAT